MYMILKLNYQEQKQNQEGMCMSENRNPSECILPKGSSREYQLIQSTGKQSLVANLEPGKEQRGT